MVHCNLPRLIATTFLACAREHLIQIIFYITCKCSNIYHPRNITGIRFTSSGNTRAALPTIYTKGLRVPDLLTALLAKYSFGPCEKAHHGAVPPPPKRSSTDRYDRLSLLASALSFEISKAWLIFCETADCMTQRRRTACSSS